MEFPNNFIKLSEALVVGAAVIQFILFAYFALSLRLSAKERREMNKEMFGLLRKIEGLTATRREQMIRHYDTILDTLSTRLPPTIAAEASEIILETERKILTRLAELEPAMKRDDLSKKKMDELIKSMEKLEHTLVSLTSETVRKVMVESRKSLLDEDAFTIRERAA